MQAHVNRVKYKSKEILFKSKIILTSDGIDSKELFEYFSSMIDKTTSIGIITSAKDEKERASSPQRHKKIFLDMAAGKVDFIDLEFENPNKILNYNLLLLEGGNPIRLMHWIRESKSESIFKKFS